MNSFQRMKASKEETPFRLPLSLVAASLLALLTLPSFASPSFPIDRIAGAGLITDDIDQSANVVMPTDIKIDPGLLIFVADAGNDIIYRLDPWAVAQILVGDGVPGFQGDGGSLSEARVNDPQGVWPDDNFNLYIADTGNRRIRKARYQDDVIETVAGSDAPGLSGIGGLATDAGLLEPVSVAADESGGFYFADASANEVFYVGSDGMLRRFAGGGSEVKDGGSALDARLDRPVSLQLDPDGNLYVAEENGPRVRKITPSGVATVIADGTGIGGIALTAPRGLAYDPDAGDLYLSDNHWILKYNSGKLELFAGTGTAGYAGDNAPLSQSELFEPRGLSWDKTYQRLQIADSGNAFINLASDGELKPFTRRGFGLGQDALNAKIAWPDAVAYDSEDLLLFANPGHHLVWRVKPNPDANIQDEPLNLVEAAMGDGSLITIEGQPANGTGLLSPSGLATAPDGSYYVSDRGNHVVIRVGTDGIAHLVAGTGTAGFSGDGGSGTKARLNGPSGIVLDGEGNLYIADSGNGRIRRLDANGTIATIAGTGSARFDGDGNALSVSLNDPTALALDGQGRLYVADTGNDRIRRIDADGSMTTVVGTGEAGFDGDGGPATHAKLSRPLGVWADGAGNLFLSDSGNNRIRMVSASGVIETVAGEGDPGSDGDGYDAPSAHLYEPAGMAANSTGDLAFADRRNNRIRILYGAAAPLGTLPAGPKGSAPPAVSAILGDLNGDGRITILDVTLALQFAVGLKTPTANDLTVADFNHNGRIDASEATTILRAAIGLTKLG